jgi:hypothetical protein
MAGNTEGSAGEAQLCDGTGVDVDPDTVRQTGAYLRELAASQRIPTAEPATPSQTTIGHPGLTAALAEFLDVAHERRADLADHLDAMAAQTEHIARRYEDTDTAAARTLDQR